MSKQTIEFWKDFVAGWIAGAVCVFVFGGSLAAGCAQKAPESIPCHCPKCEQPCEVCK